MHPLPPDRASQARSAQAYMDSSAERPRVLPPMRSTHEGRSDRMKLRVDGWTTAPRDDPMRRYAHLLTLTALALGGCVGQGSTSGGSPPEDEPQARGDLGPPAEAPREMGPAEAPDMRAPDPSAADMRASSPDPTPDMRADPPTAAPDMRPAPMEPDMPPPELRRLHLGRGPYRLADHAGGVLARARRREHRPAVPDREVLLPRRLLHTRRPEQALADLEPMLGH